MEIVVTTLKLFTLAHAFVSNETFGVESSLVDSLLLRMLPFPNIMSGRYNLEGDFFGVELGRSEGPET